MKQNEDFFQFLEKHDTSKIDEKKNRGINRWHKSKNLVSSLHSTKEKLRRCKKVETVCKTLFFDSASEASFRLGYFNNNTIKDAIKNKTKCSGYYWQYVKEDTNEI